MRMGNMDAVYAEQLISGPFFNNTMLPQEQALRVAIDILKRHEKERDNYGDYCIFSTKASYWHSASSESEYDLVLTLSKEGKAMGYTLRHKDVPLWCSIGVWAALKSGGKLIFGVVTGINAKGVELYLPSKKTYVCSEPEAVKEVALVPYSYNEHHELLRLVMQPIFRNTETGGIMGSCILGFCIDVPRGISEATICSKDGEPQKIGLQELVFWNKPSGFPCGVLKVVEESK